MPVSTDASHKVETPTAQYVDNEKLINEEYKIWKKTVPLLYDTIQTYAQKTPTLTIETLPEFEFSTDQNELNVKFLLGTYSHDTQNYLRLASVSLPSTLSPNSKTTIPIQTGPPLFSKFKILQQWKHQGEVNKARFNRANSKIATFTKTGDIKLWDFDNEESISTLKFHKKDGFGLEWGSNANHLLTGGEDSKIALWDIENPSKPTRVFKTHDSIINDFSWNSKIPTLFGSVSDDLSVQFHDIRNNDNEPLIKISEAHQDAINAIEFNPVLSEVFVTGSADNLISIWDLRNTSAPVRQLYGHINAVNQLKFNPNSPHLLASGSNDRRINIWDLNKIDEEFDVDDFVKGENDDPALLFTHGGHAAKITEFGWISGAINTVVSAAEDNLIEIWKPHLDEEEEEEEEEGEEEQKEEVVEEETKDDGNEEDK